MTEENLVGPKTFAAMTPMSPLSPFAFLKIDFLFKHMTNHVISEMYHLPSSSHAVVMSQDFYFQVKWKDKLIIIKKRKRINEEKLTIVLSSRS